jgi:hypothetical protein
MGPPSVPERKARRKFKVSSFGGGDPGSTLKRGAKRADGAAVMMPEARLGSRLVGSDAGTAEG